MADLQQLGRYQIRRILGQGAMGVVYEGFDPTLNRRVAVKTILKSHHLDPGTAADYSKRFVREAQAAARLNHPNIVQVHDFADDDEVAYLVMEFIQGRELRSYFEDEERFELDESVRVMSELLDALDFAHESGVIHRDVKPANVIIDLQRRVKLADFGVARIQDGADRSQAGTMVGTPAYMSPEQITGSKVDRRTDVFSAGVILYELLTGRRPFTGAGAWTVAKQIVQDEPPRPSSVNVSVSPAFDSVIKKALAKKPEERFATSRDLRAALNTALSRAGLVKGEQEAVQISRTSTPSASLAKPPEPTEFRRPAEVHTSEAELEFWRSIKGGGDLQELELFVRKFPDSTYRELAAIKIEKLRDLQTAPRKAHQEPAQVVAGETALLDPRAKSGPVHDTPHRQQVHRVPATTIPHEKLNLVPQQTGAQPERRFGPIGLLMIVIAIAGAGAGAYLYFAKNSVLRGSGQSVVEGSQRPDSQSVQKAQQAIAAKEAQEAKAAEQLAAEKRVAEKLATEKLAAQKEEEARSLAEKAKLEATEKARMAAAANARREAEIAADDDKAWDFIKDSSDPKSFGNYLNGFPKGRHTNHARARLKELEAASNLAETNARADRAAWDSIRNSSNRADFARYLQTYPNGMFAAAARATIQALDSAASAAATTKTTAPPPPPALPVATSPQARPSAPQPSSDSRRRWYTD